MTRSPAFRYANFVFLCLVFAVSVYNGASFYIGKIDHRHSCVSSFELVAEVFSRQYIKSLELLQEDDGSSESQSSTTEAGANKKRS